MQSVSSVHSTAIVTPTRTQTASRATTDPIPDVTTTEPADLRSRLENGEALQARAESAGVEPETSTTTDAGTTSSTLDTTPGALPARQPITDPGATTSSRGSVSSPAGGGPSGRDATRSIEHLASTMAVDTVTVQQSIADGSFSQLLAQNGVQSSIGMLFNTKL